MIVGRGSWRGRPG